MSRDSIARQCSRSRKWKLSTLEPRLMLAADCGEAIAEGPADVPVAAQQVSDVTDLVIIDSGIGDVSALVNAVSEGATIVLLDSAKSGMQQVTEAIAGHQNLNSVQLFCHGAEGALSIGNETLCNENIDQYRLAIASWGNSFADGGDLVIYGCDVAKGTAGIQFLDQIASIAGVDVAGSNDKTGASDHLSAADWDLEYHVGSIESVGQLSPTLLRSFQGQLGIDIYAAGSTTDELMELEINGTVVDTWFVRGTDAENEAFLRFSVDIDGVSADDIRINFANDLYDPSSGIDRNLRVDRIVVDGVTYQTEHPSVYTTGAWTDEFGLSFGFYQTEYLVAGGYFQYSSAGAENASNNSTIEASVRGETGTEQFQILVDGNVLGTFDATTSDQIYSVTAEGDVTADRVRVQFINDAYDPGQNFDRNLNVDFIRIDGNTVQTEDASTFSTGTWLAQDGVQPGFRQSERLNANGYFQYQASSNPPTGGNAGSFSLVTSEITAIEGQGSITLEVQRIGGSSGAASIEYFTAGDSAIEGQDFEGSSGRLFFGDGETSKSITVNLVNDSDAEGTENFAVRIDNSVGADLLAPRTSIITLLDDDSGLPRFLSFDSSNGLSLNGSATVTGGQLELTSAGAQQAGSAFFDNAVSIDSQTSFQSDFTFQIGGGSGENGADGMAFVLQSAGTGAIGQNGGQLGYSGIGQSIAIEFDTSQGPWDIARDTVAVTLNGNVAGAIAEVVSPFNLNNNTRYHAWIEYNGDTNNLAVFLSETDVKPIFAVLKTQVDLDNVLGDQAYAGFSAGNYNRPNYHRVGSWNFSLDVPDGDPPLNPSGNVVEQDLVSGLSQPLAVSWSPDGRNLYIGEKGGVIKVARDGNSSASTVLDISDMVNNVQDRGLIDFELDPNFQSNGYIYLLYTYDPPQVFEHVGNGLAGPDGSGNRAGRLSRFTLDANTGFTTVVQGSEQILLGKNSTWENFNAFTDSTTNFGEPEAGRQNGQFIQDFINSDSRSHTVGSLAFASDGNLFVSIGDGASFSRTDTRALRVQDVNSLSGKVLRIDPNTGRGVSDNPFYDGNPDSNRSKVYQLGLRNPWRLTVDQQTDRLFIGETGLNTFEEINTGDAGANFGWPFYEGRQGSNRAIEGYRDLPQAGPFYQNNNATPAVIALPHQDGTNAIVLGDIVYNSDLGIQYEGDIFYNDLYRGVVRHADVQADGSLTGVSTFATGAGFVVDIQQGPDGSLYYVNLVQGTVGKWQIV